MVGEKKGFLGRLKNVLVERNILNKVHAIHCILHQEALCAKSVPLKSVLDIVVKIINKIKGSALKHRQFRQLLKDLGESTEVMKYFCDVRWLSRGSMLRRFFDLREVVVTFMREQGMEIKELSDKTWICDLAYLCDICEHLNNLNVRLQGRQKNVVAMYSTLQAFTRKLTLLMEHLNESQLQYFPCLQSLPNIAPHKLNNYIEMLNILKQEFCETQIS
ncbi:hypothetical protein ANN_27042 [Periplaneta americana]|uniref:Uncharacterized protein n=1 Tax=Periplaneta americana TaxID=6978 RepID=A0ABQ8RWZ4_PERAM|nr:hypothetical protein ANN_27042 [Periplaneta americana]